MAHKPTKTIRPFANGDGYTPFNHALIDHVMPTLSPNAWKILCLIIRKTVGWQKQWDAISYSQIRKLAGIRSDETVSNNLNELIAKGYVGVEPQPGEKEANRYWLNTDFQLEVEDKPAAYDMVDDDEELLAYRRPRSLTEHQKRFSIVQRTMLTAEGVTYYAEKKTKDDSVGKVARDLNEMGVTLAEMHEWAEEWHSRHPEPEEPNFHHERLNYLVEFKEWYRQYKQGEGNSTPSANGTNSHEES